MHQHVSQSQALPVLCMLQLAVPAPVRTLNYISYIPQQQASLRCCRLVRCRLHGCAYCCRRK